MANARLKLARVQSRKRRRSDADSLEQDQSEVPMQLSRSNSQNYDQEEPEPAPVEGADAARAALSERKHALEMRLSELALGKPLVRVDEPGVDANGVRLKRLHRDFLLQEMEWMAADFAQERKWRMKTARTLAASVASHHSKRASRTARQEKMEEENRRRVAARVGREVKKFWTKIDKIISFKVKLQSDELRKAAMDRHLKSLVAQTERYASALAVAFCEPHDASVGEPEEEQQEEEGVRTEEVVEKDTKEEKGNETRESREYDPGGAGGGARERDDDGSDSDFADADEEEVDDETTIDAEEKQLHGASQADDAEDEIATLQRESEMSLDELRVKYALAANREAAGGADDDEAMDVGGASDDSDFAILSSDEENAVDDEETMAEEERRTSRADVADEIARLQEESEMTIEELRARYAAPRHAGDEDENEWISDTEASDGGVINGVTHAGDDDSDEDEYRPSSVEELDDETTLEVAERTEFTQDEVDEEVRLLNEESELSVDELRARYTAMLNENDDGQDPDNEREEACDSENDSDFDGTDEEDDETTIAEAEKSDHRTKADVDDEIAALEEEGTLTVDELRARYYGEPQESPMTVDESEEVNEEDNQDSDKDDYLVDTTDKEEHTELVENAARVTIAQTTDDGDAGVEATSYKRPFLLTSRLELREYQQAGVNWLTSMCEKRINGILADEMGLGKTIQTITMLAHLACARGVWGPHLIVVPTSCMVNWEMEFKRWCPAFKVLTYFGSAKRRKELRHGWSKQNAFQVCITSYQLVVQDAHCFKRKKWYYLILDEAHNIKNWKSLRWQTLLHFNSQRRLLLTGTPLQNNIMELWSLMHFLMPHVFASRKEFTYWFQNPLTVMVEESTGKSGDERSKSEVLAAEQQQLVAQLHGIIRPFVLRRLKKDVAKQLPGKFEHVINCSLSKRQRFLYEDFISRSSTRRALFGSGKRGGGSGNFMSMMNVLMQLRKVCNHPDLFEPRPIESPLDMESLTLGVPARCGFVYDWLDTRSVAWWPVSQRFANQELSGVDKFVNARAQALLHFYDDVSLSEGLPSECSLAAKQPTSTRPDVLKRLLRLAQARREYWEEKRRSQSLVMRVATHLHEPMLGSDLIHACTMPVFISNAMEVHRKRADKDALTRSIALSEIVKDPEERIVEMLPTVRKAVCVVPKARARPLEVRFGGKRFSADSGDFGKLSRKLRLEEYVEEHLKPVATRCLDPFYESFKRTQLFFPDKRLIQFDCGKLQQLDLLLRELKRGKHRCLIFTQMSSMLNFLEIFLNLHGYTYFRLDGSTKVETRQYLMEKFNHDDKIFCFILSTRSGGLGINLTGADSVIFYDSDWNPAMDAQAQDRAHRIGQTRDVHIYRLVSEHTVEENILKKAQQKRHLDFLVMAKGEFTTEFFSKASLRELMGDLDDKEVTGVAEESRIEELEDDDEEGAGGDSVDDDEMSLDAIESAMAQLEDEDDVVAMRGAREEFMSEQREFDEEASGAASGDTRRVSNAGTEASRASTPTNDAQDDDEEEKDDGGDGEDDARRTALAENESSTASVVDDDEITMTRVADDGSANTPAVSADAESVERDTSVRDDDEDVGTADESDVDKPEEEEEEEEEGESDIDSDEDMSDEDEDELPKVRAKSTRPTAGRKRCRGSTASVSHAATKKLKSDADAALVTAAQERKKQERVKEKAREQEEERKLQAWKDSVSSLQNFEESLNSVDRYALHFREDVDPLFAYVPTAEAYSHLEDEAKLLVNIEEIEARKMVEEQQWIADGELIAGVSDLDELSPSEIDMHFQLYKKERSNVHASRRQRQLTGEAWELKKCAITGQPFYYNSDTREATWEKPTIWVKNEQCETARAMGFAGFPMNVLLLIFSKLHAYPDRLNGVQLVCHRWREAALHPSLSVRVNATDFFYVHGDPGRRDHWNELLRGVGRGETLLFGSGVYEIHDVVEISKPIRFLAAHDAHVELQMATPRAQIKWTARGGLVCGFHISRRHSSSVNGAEPTNNWQHLLHITQGGSVRAVFNDFDGNHQGNACLAVSGDPLSLLVLQHNRIFHSGSGSGILVLQGALVMQRNSVFQNAHSGITVWSGNAVLRRNQIFSNERFGIRLLYHANNVVVEENKVENHPCGNIDVENSGRRFVVRWNEMLKDEVEDLPHRHGQVKLLTSRVEERVIKVAEKPKPAAKRKPKVVQPKLEPAGDVTTPLSNALAAVFAPPIGTPTPTVSSVVAARLVFAAPGGAKTVVAASTSLAQPAPKMPVAVATTAAVLVKTEQPSAQVAKTTTVANGLAVSKLPSMPANIDVKPGGPQPEALTAVAVPAAGMVASVPSAAPATAIPSITPVTAMPSIAPATAVPSIAPVSSPAHATVIPLIAPATAVPSIAPATAVPSAAPATAVPAAGQATSAQPQTPVKARRKRKPKTEKVLVHGVEMVFRDTCEKKGEKKVKKPRRASGEGATPKTKTEASSTPTVSQNPTVAAASVEATPRVDVAEPTLSSVRPHLEETVEQVTGSDETVNNPEPSPSPAPAVTVQART